MPNPKTEATVDAFVSSTGGVYLWVRPKWSFGYQMHEECDQPLFVRASSRYIADGQWWDAPQPLSSDSIDIAFTALGMTDSSDWLLLQTRGPALALDANSWLPTTYRVVDQVPKEVNAYARTVAMGIKRFTEVHVAEFELQFWTRERNKLAWQYIQTWLPAEIPRWELIEAKEVFTNGKRVPWMAAVSLASSRRHYFHLRHQYNTFVLGREETDEEREQRLHYDRDSRVMSAFYRAFTSSDGKASLLRKTKSLGAKRLVNAYDRQLKEVYDRLEAQFEQLRHDLDTWVTNAYKENN
jgi:hypothetical protein